MEIHDDQPQVLMGSWTCRGASRIVTYCLTGRVRTATFRPRRPVVEYDQAFVQLNPAGPAGDYE